MFGALHSKGHRTSPVTAMVFLEQLLGKIDAELKGHKDECDEMAQIHLDWLTETVQTNKRKLKYQMCVL